MCIFDDTLVLVNKVSRREANLFLGKDVVRA